MPFERDAPFANPQAPPGYEVEHHRGDSNTQRLTNDDFRKLLMTPRAGAPGAEKPASSVPKPMRTSTLKKAQRKISAEAATRRRERKAQYAQIAKEDKEREDELNEKYRDRAQERREGKNPDYESVELLSTSTNYRTVAPDIKANFHVTQERKRIIAESKFLGGDIQHTWMVKGLDYVLLEKVRTEIVRKEDEEEIEEEEEEDSEKEEEVDESQIAVNGVLAKNVCRVLFKNKPPRTNDLFLPRRMAYVIDLEDEYNDLPTTMIRSKAECAGMESATSLSTNDIVINKLTQILSYLRQGKRDPKKSKKKAESAKEEPSQLQPRLPDADVSIYDDVEDYNPEELIKPVKEKPAKEPEKEVVKEKGDREHRHREHDRTRDREREQPRDREREKERDHRDHRDREKERDKDRDADRDRERDKERDHRREPREQRDEKADRRGKYFERFEEEEPKGPDRRAAHDFVKNVNEKFSQFDVGRMKKEKEKEPEKQGTRIRFEDDSYAECYPGTMAEADVTVDSDDEPDYERMDQGNKKGPIGRWDFDSTEEYSDYMSQREAMPRAAFQYGVKMSEGRKTRRAPGQKDEKAKLDREWQKISKIIEKRKADGPPASGEIEFVPKTPKF